MSKGQPAAGRDHGRNQVLRHGTGSGLSSLAPWFRLVKGLLCLPIALSAGFGALLFSPYLNLRSLLLVLGVYLLACGAAALNSLQEVDTDRLYQRTCQRPLVTGTIGSGAACLLILLLFSVALLLLRFAAESAVPLFLACLGVGLYNGLYTPLKKRSSFALLIGGLSGATPPLIGWTAAGGPLFAPPALILASLFFLWQIPHFLMVLLHHHRDYASAPGFNLTQVLAQERLRRLALLWTLAYTTVALALSALPGFLHPLSRLSNILAALTILLAFSYQLLIRPSSNYWLLFQLLNLIFFAAMGVIAATELLATFLNH
ncbi:UbiA family prenyltransferase [Desulfogranum mediterraneum]|uniref:UbiA family prenyltransferase n=1 Tax=Desulfogranum mediterraneum TaxID=160661 RepID=UPI0004009709|nr:UbiA family prenyltransferase [Desulfogranum mediterraneum]